MRQVVEQKGYGVVNLPADPGREPHERTVTFVDVLLSRDRVLRGDLEGVPEPLGPDPESARELLQDAGWKDADGAFSGRE